MVVDGIEHFAPDDRPHALDYPFASGIGILAGERHSGEILAPKIGILVQQRRRDVDALLATGEFQERGRDFVPQATRSEVDTDPDEAFLVLEQVDVVVARADGAELLARHGFEAPDDVGFLP